MKWTHRDEDTRELLVALQDGTVSYLSPNTAAVERLDAAVLFIQSRATGPSLSRSCALKRTCIAGVQVI